MDPKAKADIEAIIARAATLPDYEAVDVLWVALVQVSNSFPQATEHARMLSLLESAPESALARTLALQAVDRLITLDPPIETVLTNAHEHLAREKTTSALVSLRNNRQSHPRLATEALMDILKRIRNKRAHGFKSPLGPRDRIILLAAREVLVALCALAVET